MSEADAFGRKAIADIDRVLSAKTMAAGGTGAITEVVMLRVACLRRWAPPGSDYAKQAERLDPLAPSHERHEQKSDSVLRALKADYEAGQLRPFRALVEASLFDDFLHQASYLASGEYLLAATVMAGGVLEERLRKLAEALGVPVSIERDGKSKHRTASDINNDVCKTGLYANAQRSQIQSWLDVRNSAAHHKPEFQSESKESIDRMIGGIRDFLVKYEA